MVYDEQDQFNWNRQLQQDQIEGQQSLYAPQIREQTAQAQGVIIAQTDPRKVVTDIFYEFQGYEQNDSGEWIQRNPPVMNAIGIRKLKSILRPLMNDSVRWGRLDKKQVADFTKIVADHLTFDLGARWREYGISDTSACDYIVDSIIVCVYTMLSRAEDQNEKNWMGRVSFESLSNASSKINKPKDGGWLDKLRL